jgi:hypothetical protein
MALFQVPFAREGSRHRQHLAAHDFSEAEFGAEVQRLVPLTKYAPNGARARPSAQSQAGKRARQLLALCYQWYREVLAPSALWHVQPASDENMGLGLFAKKRQRVEPRHSLPHLTGSISVLHPGVECEAVRAGGYPRLFQTDDGHLALCWGPAALANRACDSRLVLSPSTTASDGPNTMHVVVCGQNDVTVQAGEEVLLDHKEADFVDTKVCRCRACAAKKSKVDDGKGTTIYTNETDQHGQ